MESQALNYTPSIEVGDVLVWKTEIEFLGEIEISYAKYNITCIEDDSGKTIVNANCYTSNDNINYIFHSNQTIGALQNYMEDVFSLYGDKVIIPGTKIADYPNNFLSFNHQVPAFPFWAW